MIGDDQEWTALRDVLSAMSSDVVAKMGQHPTAACRQSITSNEIIEGNGDFRQPSTNIAEKVPAKPMREACLRQRNRTHDLINQALA